MVVTNAHDLDRRYGLKINASVTLCWNWIMGWPKDKTLVAGKVDSEMTFETTHQLMPPVRWLMWHIRKATG